MAGDRLTRIPGAAIPRTLPFPHRDRAGLNIRNTTIVFHMGAGSTLTHGTRPPTGSVPSLSILSPRTGTISDVAYAAIFFVMKAIITTLNLARTPRGALPKLETHAICDGTAGSFFDTSI